MQLRCDTATGDNVEMGETIFPSDPAKSIYTVDFEIPSDPLSFFTFNGTALVRKADDVISKIEAQENFDVKKMALDLRGILQSLSDIKLRWEFAALEAYAEADNFADMKSYLQLLLSQNIMTQADYDLVNGVMKNQNIDLDTF